jgi:hypothetical protein
MSDDLNPNILFHDAEDDDFNPPDMFDELIEGGHVIDNPAVPPEFRNPTQKYKRYEGDPVDVTDDDLKMFGLGVKVSVGGSKIRESQPVTSPNGLQTHNRLQVRQDVRDVVDRVGQTMFQEPETRVVGTIRSFRDKVKS